jgi:hypothetical protein
MCDQQLHLFSSVGIQAQRPLAQNMELPPTASALDNQALIAAIPESNLADSIALAAEAARRRLAAAVPSLETLCQRFSGFGIDRMVPEQAAALQALAVISRREAPGPGRTSGCGRQLVNCYIRYATVKINNFVPWRPLLKQLPPPRSKKLAAEIDPNQSYRYYGGRRPRRIILAWRRAPRGRCRHFCVRLKYLRSGGA